MSKFEHGQPSTEQPREEPRLLDIVVEYGPDVARAIVQEIDEAIRSRETFNQAEIIRRHIEHLMPESTFKKAALEWMQKQGFLEILSDETLIVDDQMLFSHFSIAHLEDVPGRPFAGMERFTQNRLAFLGFAFADRLVVLKNEYRANPDTPPKPLFYLPKSKQEALDVNVIRSADFHFGLWQFPRVTHRIPGATAAQPGTTDDLTYLEASLAAILYHPKFGNGRRDERKRLILGSEEAKLRLSGDWLARHGLNFGSKEKLLIKNRPLVTIAKYAPRLFETGLLRSADFARPKLDSATLTITPGGQLRLDGVRHYVGKSVNGPNGPIELSGKQVVVDDLDGLRVVVSEIGGDGTIHPLVIINKIERDDARVSRYATGNSFALDAGAKLTQPTAWGDAKFGNQLTGETFDQFAARKEAVIDYRRRLDFNNVLRLKFNLDINELPADLLTILKKNTRILSAAMVAVWEICQLGQIEGLCLVAALSDNSKFLIQVADELKKLPPAEAAGVIPQLLEAAKARQQVLQEIPRQEDLKANVFATNKLRFETARWLQAILAVARDRVLTVGDSGDSLTQLEKVRSRTLEATLWAKLFSDVFKGSSEFSFDDIKDAEVTTVRGTKPDQAVIDHLVAIADINWSSVPSMKDYVSHHLKDSLENPSEKTEFYILNIEGAPVACIRFDYQDDGSVYAGSLNVDPQYRGHYVGNALIKNTMDALAQDRVIHGQVLAQEPLISAYVERMNFIITGVNQAPTTNGETLDGFDILRDDNLNQDYSARRIPTAELIAATDGQVINNLTVRRFDLDTDQTALREAFNVARDQGLVATRFVIDPNNPKTRILTFEKRLSADDEAISPTAEDAAAK